MERVRFVPIRRSPLPWPFPPWTSVGWSPLGEEIFAEHRPDLDAFVVVEGGRQTIHPTPRPTHDAWFGTRRRWNDGKAVR